MVEDEDEGIEYLASPYLAKEEDNSVVYCTSCGKPVLDTDKYCRNCGNEQT